MCPIKANCSGLAAAAARCHIYIVSHVDRVIPESVSVNEKYGNVAQRPYSRPANTARRHKDLHFLIKKDIFIILLNIYGP